MNNYPPNQGFPAQQPQPFPQGYAAPQFNQNAPQFDPNAAPFDPNAAYDPNYANPPFDPNFVDPNAPPVNDAVAAALAEVEQMTPLKRFWRKYGGESFLISVGVHIVFFILAYVVFKTVVYIATAPQDDFVTGAGGGNEGNKVSMLEHRIKPKHAKNAAKNVPKLVAKGASSISLPEMPKMTMALESGSPMGASSKGFGGGAGGGVGGGIGPGRGGGRNMVSLFGASGFNVAGLSGALYDCKQTPSGQFRDPGVGGYVGYVTKFLNSGFDVSFLQSKFYQSKEKLALQQVYIPMMDANGAPAAFNCQKEVKPSRWIVHYKGSVTAPFSGRMRFVGMADDWIAVKFNNKTALLSGYGNSIDGAKYPGKTPPPGVGGSYEYGGGRPPFRTGPWIDVREGTSYPIEVAMGETPGGQFCAALAFQKGSENSPLLLFRMTGDKDFNAVLKASKGGHFPPNVDLSGGKYVWKPKMANNNRRSR